MKPEGLLFMEWAEANGYDMTQHPLHFLFLNKETYAARQGWKAGHAAATPQPPVAPAAPVAGSGWVSCADRLPEGKHGCIDYSARVLAFGDGGIDGPHFVAYYSLDGLWFLAHDNQPIMTVTHWMPLPTPPTA